MTDLFTYESYYNEPRQPARPCDLFEGAIVRVRDHDNYTAILGKPVGQDKIVIYDVYAFCEMTPTLDMIHPCHLHAWIIEKLGFNRIDNLLEWKLVRLFGVVTLHKLDCSVDAMRGIKPRYPLYELSWGMEYRTVRCMTDIQRAIQEWTGELLTITPSIVNTEQE